MSYGPDTNREPCPDRIVDDAGGAFAMGAIGGSIYHGFRGARNAPAGNRVPHAMDAIRARAPPLGGGFAMWGGLFSTFDCALQAIRHKDDPLNAIASGGITGGVLAARGGMRAAGKSAAIGAVLLAIIEGVGIMGTKLMSDPQFSGGALSREMMADQLQQQQQMALDQAKQNAEQDDTKQGWWSDGGNGGVAPATG